MPKANREFNNGQPIQGMKNDPHLHTKEVMVPFKCDVHGWMNAYVGVLDHPYFAVTGRDGKFELKGLPPGTYTIEAWHEKLGRQTQSVTIGAKEAKEVTFTFKPRRNRRDTTDRVAGSEGQERHGGDAADLDPRLEPRALALPTPGFTASPSSSPSARSC